MKRITIGLLIFLGMWTFVAFHKSCAQVKPVRKSVVQSIPVRKSGVSHWPISGHRSPIVKESKITGADWGREKPLPDSVNIKLILIQKEIIELKKEIIKLKKSK